MDPLASATRWVAWRNEPRGDKLTKVPYAPSGGTAKADDPATWATRAAAETRAQQLINGHGGGIGIELGDLGADTYLGGMDLDSCLNGEPVPLGRKRFVISPRPTLRFRPRAKG